MKVCPRCGVVRDLWPLTPALAEVIKLLAVDGDRYVDIARKLGITRHAVRTRVERATAKLGCATVYQAIRKLAERGYFKE